MCDAATRRSMDSPGAGSSRIAECARRSGDGPRIGTASIPGRGVDRSSVSEGRCPPGQSAAGGLGPRGLNRVEPTHESTVDRVVLPRAGRRHRRETAISNIEGRDGAGGLEYRGYRIEDLAGQVSYEETAFLLLHGDLPNRRQLREFDARLRRLARLPEPLIALFAQIPPRDANPMDVLRTSVSVLAHFDPDGDAPPTDHAANVRKAERLIAQMPTAVAYRERIGKGLPPIAPDADLGPRRQLPVHGQRQGPVAERCARRSTSRWSSTPSTS